MSSGPDLYLVCKSCGAVERIEYTAELEENGALFAGWYRLIDGKKVYSRDDNVCGCGKYRRNDLLKVTYKAGHLCDDRCKNAKSSKCLCSCKGKYHAINYEKAKQASLLFA